MLGGDGDDPIAGVDEPLDLESNALELREQGFVVFADGIPAAIDTRLRRLRVGVELDLGVTLGKAGLFADAEVALRQAAEANPRDVRSLYWLGIAQAQLGKGQEARQSFERFIALAPSRYARQVETARARVAQLGGGQ